MGKRKLDQSDRAKEALKKAEKIAKSSVELGAALGVRTKWQQKKISQLLVRVKQEVGDEEDVKGLAGMFSHILIGSGSDATSSKGEGVENDVRNARLPRNVALDDTDVLGYVKYDEVEGNTEGDDEDGRTIVDEHLYPIQQAIVIAHALIVRLRNVSHKLTDEEMYPYVNRVLEARVSKYGSNSSLQLRALLLRAHIERERGRYMERCMTQLEAINDFVDSKMEGMKEEDRNMLAMERVAFIFASALPSRWELKKELAIALGSMALVKSAIEIFKQLEYWDELVDCHRLIGNLGVAENIVKEQLKQMDDKRASHKKTFSSFRKCRLLCILGDITRDITKYNEAWKDSGHRYARAKRSLGRAMFEKDQWKEAICHFEEALALNPLHPDVWFILGCCGLKVDDLKVAANAFTRVVQQTPDHAEAWNNLGRVLADSGKPKEAMKALGEATRLRRESWQIWNNLISIAAAVKAPLQIISAQEALLDLKGKEHIRSHALAVAVNVIVDMSSSDQADERAAAAKLCKRLLTVLGRITTMRSSDPVLWGIYARLYEQIAPQGWSEKAVECRRKQIRALTSDSEWAYEKEKFQSVVKAASALVQDASQCGDKTATHFVKMQVKNLVLRAEDTFEGTDLYKKLLNLQIKLEGGVGSQ